MHMFEVVTNCRRLGSMWEARPLTPCRPHQRQVAQNYTAPRRLILQEMRHCSNTYQGFYTVSKADPAIHICSPWRTWHWGLYLKHNSCSLSPNVLWEAHPGLSCANMGVWPREHLLSFQKVGIEVNTFYSSKGHIWSNLYIYYVVYKDVLMYESLNYMI